ncbi:MAG: hypothetical protein WA580_05715, partial [Acidimicrobiales bacterium]
AILVVVLGAPASAAAALHNFRHLWIFIASSAILAGLICSLLMGGGGTSARPTLASEEARGLEEVLDGEIVLDAE